MDPAQIVEFLIETLRTSGPMLGAPLGGLLNKTFPSLKGSPGYGSLGTFIERHCAGQIARKEWNGSDFQFALVARGEAPKASDTTPKFAAWGAFLKADLPIQIAVDLKTGDLRTLATGEVVDEPWQIVPKLTSVENREIAQLFIQQVAKEDKQIFLDAIQVDNYWPGWSRIVNQTHAAKYKQQWGKHRFEQICARFHERMREAGLNNETAAKALKNLRSDKERHATVAKGFAEGHPADRLSLPASKLMKFPHTLFKEEDDSLRSIAQRVVCSLSEDELRRLWLPLGEVMNALRQIRR